MVVAFHNWIKNIPHCNGNSVAMAKYDTSIPAEDVPYHFSPREQPYLTERSMVLGKRAFQVSLLP